jgi:putative oxidoreductase
LHKLEEFLGKYQAELLSILRIIAALLFLQHGLSKFFGFPVPAPANFNAMSIFGVAGVIEVVGGILLAIGLWSRWAALIMSGEMAVAYFYVNRMARHWAPLGNGGELEVLYIFVFLYLAAAGPGPWSVDAAMQGGRRRR